LALRDTASALSQLHGAGVAHQDVKPSNAVCPDGGAIKLTDLGSSSCEKIDPPPHDIEYLVGQPNYAPYELLYEHPPSTWRRRRFGCDLFLLGNLCFTSFVGGSLSCLALHTIPTELRHSEFSGDYQDVMPHLIEAHHLLVPAMLGDVLPETLAGDLSEIVLSLCHPNPLCRGHSKNRAQHNNPFGLERFITKFDVFAKKAKTMHFEYR
jgi:serine/threonine protein kinase